VLTRLLARIASGHYSTATIPPTAWAGAWNCNVLHSGDRTYLTSSGPDGA